MKRRWLAAVAAALILPACGGDHSGQKTQTPTTSDPDIETFADEGQMHVPVGTVIAYRTDPPTSGPHYPDPQDGGFFDREIAAGFLVHSMEHGAIVIYYHGDMLTNDQINDLQRLARQHPGTFSQVICVPREDDTYPIILTAWTHRLRLTAYDKDRIDGFVALYLGQGPEQEPMP
jgi:hypothetical protein